MDSADNDSDHRSHCSASSQLAPGACAYDTYAFAPDAPRRELYDARPRRLPARKGPKPETKL